MAKWDLLYVANTGQGVVNVYRYWQRDLVGILTDATEPRGECVDASGDVYVADYRGEKIVEYAHGGKKKMRLLDDSPYEPEGCAVNVRTGDLAVANYDKYPSGRGNLAVYRHASGKPLYFSSPLYRYQACAYDSKGNLLTTDGEYDSSGYGSDFAWLAKNGVKLVPITVRGGSSRYGNFNGVVDIVWDGKYFVLSASYYGENLTRVRVQDGRGKAIGTTYVNGENGYLGDFAFYSSTPGGQATQVVASFSDYRSDSEVGYWKYPAGGSPIATITEGLDYPYGVAVSPKQQ
ncbi:MAG: hypothetical protein WA814_11990 [Candidatus Baltobacteraceae bacterium]